MTTFTREDSLFSEPTWKFHEPLRSRQLFKDFLYKAFKEELMSNGCVFDSKLFDAIAGWAVQNAPKSMSAGEMRQLIDAAWRFAMID